MKPTKKRSPTNQREVRVYPSQKFEVRKNADGTTVKGYFATWGTLSHFMGFREVVRPGAFTKSLQTQPVRCLFNHSDNMLLGRTESNTLKVQEDSTGLRFSVDLPNVSYAQDLVELMARGDAYECSWGFSVPDGGDEWTSMPDGTLLRTINTAILYEGSILVSPAAYPNTSASLRSLPKSLRSKLETKRDADDDDTDCDDADKNADGDCPDDEEEDRSECNCECSECEDGDCSDCSNVDCDDDDCKDCPATRQRNAHLELLKRRLR